MGSFVFNFFLLELFSTLFFLVLVLLDTNTLLLLLFILSFLFLFKVLFSIMSIKLILSFFGTIVFNFDSSK